MTVELLHIRDALFGIRPGNRHDRLNKITKLCKELYGDEDGSAILNSYLHDLNEWIRESSSKVLYHDLNHIFAMTLNADRIAIYYKCSKQERRNLFLACMFHDVLHSFGVLPDSLNVARATAFFGKSIIKQHFCTKQDVTTICDIIFCTVFPFRVTVNNILEKIARISDLTMCFEPDVENFAQGLEVEFKHQGKHINVTKEDMISFSMSSEYGDEIKKLLEEKVIGDH